MVGLEEMLGRAAQGVANMIGKYIGKELLKYAVEQNRKIESLDSLKSFLTDLEFAEQVKFTLGEELVEVSIEKCGICPKRVGGYEFEGTACPWSGFLRYMLKHVLNRDFSVAVKIKPGEKCVMTFKPVLHD